MSMLEDFRQQFVDKVKELSQEEGLRDGEIAEALGCSRATVNRTRKGYDIPMANLSNRKDKKCVCDHCGYEWSIRRKERRRRQCERDECNQSK